MKRPQSAKPGFKGYWGQASSDDINDQSVSSKHPQRKGIKIMKPDLTTHDFARILPKKIHQDKERLYSQALQLKQTINELMEENMRLKTKISILEKEKDKMNRYIDSNADNLTKQGNSRLNIYGAKSIEKDNLMVRNLKKIVRESRQENDYLKTENQKIKKTVKYTKINEIEIEKKIILDENKRLATMLEDINGQIMSQEEVQRENEELKKYLEEELEQNKELTDDTEKYQEIIETLEEKIKTETEKHQNKEKKLNRDLALEKRKTNEQHKYIEDLRREIKALQGNLEQVNMKKKAAKPAVRPMSSHPINYRSNTPQPKENTLNVASKDLVETEEIKRKNEQLQKELQNVRLKLQESQNQLNKRKLKDNFVKQKVELQQQAPQRPKSPDKNIKKEDSPIQKKEESSRLEKKYDFEDSPQKEDESYNNAFEPEQDDYAQDFQKTDEIKTQNQPRKTKEDEQIEKLKKDFEQNQEEEELYKKEDTHDSKKKKAKKEGEEKKKKKGQGKEKAGFKPDKKILSQIKQLLTYRMKSQRYPFQDLKADIESADASTFSYADLCNMLVNEPFYLTSLYTKAFLCYCYEKENVPQNQLLSNTVLIDKLRKVVDNFELMPENEEKEMILRIAEMTSMYPYELETAFEKIKNGEDTVSKKDLIALFKNLQLQDQYIELIIAELSLCSDDLEHLNFHGFFERFYFQDEEGYADPNAIEQLEESEQSNKNTSRVKKKGKFTRKASEEDLDDRTGGLMLAPEQPVENMNYAYDEDIVSDDGRI